jgi:hypothetical protein
MTLRLSTGLRTNIVGAIGVGATFAGGIVEVRTGSQPANADAAVTGTLLGVVTLNNLPFVPGAPANGLTFAAAVAGVLAKSGVWAMNGIAAGTAGWFRLKANALDNDALSTTLPRIDGSVATSGADMSLSNIAIAIGAPTTVDTFTVTAPAQ